MTDKQNIIKEHLNAFFSGREYVDLNVQGPINESLPSFSVRQIRPRKRHEERVYATIGVCDAYPDGESLEFVIVSQQKSDELPLLLAMVANYHSDPAHRLEEGRVVDIGTPWITEGAADHLLVSLPYYFGPSFERADGIRVLWLLPITSDEAKYVESGVAALEQRLEDAEIVPSAPRRISVVDHY